MADGTSSGSSTYTFTGYFLPPASSDYYFTVEGMPLVAFWIDAGSPSGAATGPSESNALALTDTSSDCYDWPWAARPKRPSPWVTVRI
jgi:hypothetical protein